MSEPNTNASIGGSTESGRQADAEFPFYTGRVGVRDREGWVDIAFFAPEVRVRLPALGLLDGRRVRITAISTRRLDPTARARGALYAISGVAFLDPES